MRPVCFRQYDIAVLTPHHILHAHLSSPDYHAMLIVLSPQFQEAMKQRYPDIYRDNFFYLYHQSLSLTDPHFSLVLQLFRTLHAVSSIDSPNRWHMLGDLLEVLFLLLQDYRRQNGMEGHAPSPREELFSRFYQAITRHYAQSREVKFYADLLHLSPKHFATVIKHTPASMPSNGSTTTSSSRPGCCSAIIPSSPYRRSPSGWALPTRPHSADSSRTVLASLPPNSASKTKPRDIDSSTLARCRLASHQA